MEKAAAVLLGSDCSEKSSDSLIWAESQKFHKCNFTKSAVAVLKVSELVMQWNQNDS